jgi:hypothetical protein
LRHAARKARGQSERAQSLSVRRRIQGFLLEIL